MARTEVRPVVEPTAALPPRRRWILPLAPWAIAAVLGGALAWAAPQAGRSNELRTQAAALSHDVDGSQQEVAALQASLNRLQSSLEQARDRASALAETRRGNAKRIERLETRVEELEAQAAAAAAAAAAASTSSSPSSSSTLPAVEPYEPPPVCYKVYDLSTGQWVKKCD